MNAEENIVGEADNNLRKREFLEKVYDLLVEKAGANPKDRSTFVHYHFEDTSGIRHYEWRFCGLFGFGGKYRAHSNRISCYKEDDTPVRDALMSVINDDLKTLAAEFSDVVF
jgi:hypothetical protein